MSKIYGRFFQILWPSHNISSLTIIQMNNLRLELSRRMKLRAMDNFFKSGVWQFPFLTLNYRPLGITCYNLISFRATESKFVENILKGSLDSIPSPLVKIQIMGGKVCLRCKGKRLLGIVNKLLKTKKNVDITQWGKYGCRLKICK